MTVHCFNVMSMIIISNVLQRCYLLTEQADIAKICIKMFKESCQMKNVHIITVFKDKEEEHYYLTDP